MSHSYPPSLESNERPFDPTSGLLHRAPAECEPRGLGDFVSNSPQIIAVLERAAVLARKNVTVLLLGETGTGKERLALAMHKASPRAAGPFEAVNCSLMAPELIQSELFGHRKGAFTGAVSDRDGIFVRANGGTLLLDEIGDAPLAVQNALLRVLQTCRVRAVGSDVERQVDVRVLAATSRSIARQIAEQGFRHDIYFRLAQHSLTLPPLRERNADMEILVPTILRELGSSQTLSKDAYERLRRHNWPGNTRELFNALSNAVIFAEGAQAIDAKFFSELGSVTVPLQTRDDTQAEAVAPVSARTVQFPDVVRELAERAWQASALPPLSKASQYVRRSLHRAILLSLRVTHGDARFPPALNAAWRKLFRAKWPSAEAGRGLRDLLQLLGAAPNGRARAWVLYATRWE